MEVLEEAQTNTDSFAKDLQDAFIFSLSTAYLNYRQIWIYRRAKRVIKSGKIDVAKVRDRGRLWVVGWRKQSQTHAHATRTPRARHGHATRTPRARHAHAHAHSLTHARAHAHTRCLRTRGWESR